MAKLGTPMIRIRKTFAGDPAASIRSTLVEYAVRPDGSVVKRMKVEDHDFGWKQSAKPPARADRDRVLANRIEACRRKVESEGFAFVGDAGTGGL